MNTLKSKDSRKPYHKPQVRQVELRIKDAVLATGCKTNADGLAQLITQNCAFPIAQCDQTTDIGS